MASSSCCLVGSLFWMLALPSADHARLIRRFVLSVVLVYSRIMPKRIILHHVDIV